MDLVGDPAGFSVAKLVSFAVDLFGVLQDSFWLTFSMFVEDAGRC